MKNIKDYIAESLVVEAINIDKSSSVEDLDACLDYIVKYAKSLKIQKAEQQRYEKKGTPITKEIAQDLLSKRLYNNVSVRFKMDPDYFLELCKKNDINVNMSNLGFGYDTVIKWGVPAKKMIAKDIYFDDADIVWYDKTIGFRWDDGGIEMLPEYENYAEEVLAILKKKHKYDDWYIVKK